MLLVLLWGCTPQAQRELKPGEKSITLTGAVIPFEEARVTSPTSGVVARVMVQPGQPVEAGAILLKLEPTTAIAEADRAEAALTVARTQLQQAQNSGNKAEQAVAEAEVVQLEQEMQRLQSGQGRPRSLNERAQAEIILSNARLKLRRLYDLSTRGLVAQPELESAENEYAEAVRRFRSVEAEEALGNKGNPEAEGKITAARLQAARARLTSLQQDNPQARAETATAQVRQAEADLARARYNLTQTILTAPIAGVVTTLTAQAGEKLHEGRTVAEIVDISRIKVKGDLSPGLVSFVAIGQAAKVTINTVPPTTLTASVEQLQRIADPKTQALAVTFTLPNPDYKFQPGFSAKIELPVKPEALK